MKFDLTLLLLAAVPLTNSLPQPDNSISIRDASPKFTPLENNGLFKRKGGGGGGRGGSGTHGGGGSSSSPSSGTRPAGSSTSNSGGRSSTGTGVAPNYGGGQYYSGGASVPYSAGARSPLGITPVFLGLGIVALYPGLWYHGVYGYPYQHPYTFNNASTGGNQTKNVECLCEEYQVCGCDDNENPAYVGDLLGNGSTADLDSSVVVADYNGKSTIFINGTLENGTTAANAGASLRAGMDLGGYWVMAAIVGATVMMA